MEMDNPSSFSHLSDLQLFSSSVDDVVRHELRKLCMRSEWSLALQLIQRVRVVNPGFAADVYGRVRYEVVCLELAAATAEPALTDMGVIDAEHMDTGDLARALRSAEDLLDEHDASSMRHGFVRRIARAQLLLQLRELLIDGVWDDAIEQVEAAFEEGHDDDDDDDDENDESSATDRVAHFEQLHRIEWTARVYAGQEHVNGAVAGSDEEALSAAMREIIALAQQAEDEAVLTAKSEAIFVHQVHIWIESLQQREADIESVQDAVEGALESVDKESLTSAIVAAYDAGVDNGATESAVAKLLEIRAAEPLIDEALKLDVFGDAALHAAHTAIERSAMRSPKADRVRTLLELPPVERLQVQLRAAFQCGDLALAARCAHAAKDAFFAPAAGRIEEFTFGRCPLLRSRAEVAAKSDWISCNLPGATISTSLTVALSAPSDILLAGEAWWLIRQLIGASASRTSASIAPQCMHRLIEIATQSSALRDEVLCQIMRLLLSARDEDEERAWTLMHACLLCVAPSPALENYVEAMVRSAGPERAQIAMQLHVALIHVAAGAETAMVIAGLERAVELVTPRLIIVESHVAAGARPPSPPPPTLEVAAANDAELEQAIDRWAGRIEAGERDGGLGGDVIGGDVVMVEEWKEDEEEEELEFVFSPIRTRS